MRSLPMISALAACLAFTLPAQAQKPMFDMAELPSPNPQQGAGASAINDVGMAIGTMSTGQFGIYKPVFWRDGVPELLPTGTQIIKAFGEKLNNAGDGIGSAKSNWEGLPYTIGWKNGRLYEFDHTAFQPYDVAGPGVFVGSYSNRYANDGRPLPTTWDGGDYVFLPTPQGYSGYVSMASDAGWMAGVLSRPASGSTPASSIAAVWKDGQLMEVQPPEGQLIQLLDLSDGGDLLYSWSDVQGGYHQSIWHDGQSDELLAPEGAQYFAVTDINAAGQMLAYRRLKVGPESILMYGQNGQFWDFDGMLAPSFQEAGWRVTGLTDINEKGQILASAFNDKLQRGSSVILTPVPENSTALLMCAGLAGLALLRRRPIRH